MEQNLNNWIDPTELTPQFRSEYISELQAENLPQFNDQIIAILQQWGNLGEGKVRFDALLEIGKISKTKANDKLLPHKHQKFVAEAKRLAEVVTHVHRQVVVYESNSASNSPVTKRSWKWLVWLTIGIIVGVVGCAVFENLVNNRNLEQQAIDLNKLRPEEVVRLDSYLVQYRPQIEALGRHYFPLIQRVHADAQSRMRAKGRDMAFFLATPEMVFAEIVAIQFWNHDANELRSQEELDAYFGTDGPLRLPTSNIEEVQYLRLYHPDFLIEYDRANGLGVGFGANYDITNVTPDEMLLVSLMYLSDNPGRPPVASSVVNVIEHVHETFKTW